MSGQYSFNGPKYYASLTSNSHPVTKQDLWVLSKIPCGRSFMEVGAFDGLKHSNTLLLEDHGWRGVLVEGFSVLADECKQNRPMARTVSQAIGDGTLQDYWIGGQYSGLEATMPSAFIEQHELRCNDRTEVHTKRLFQATGVKQVDYLSIDTEGSEYCILKDWFEDGGSCNALTVEFRYCEAELQRLSWLMQEQGMYLDEIRGFDLCFLRESL